MDETLTITLRKPVTLGSETYPTLALREPTADEFAQIDGLTGTRSNIALISIVSGVPKAAVGQIGLRDLMTAAGFFEGFLSSAPPTGEAQSTS